MKTQTLSKKHYYLLFCLLFGSLMLNAQGELFFSEYVEGTSNNKCIEIFNPTDQDIVLTDVYRIIQYRNGSTDPKTLSNLNGIIPAGEPYVICDRTLGTFSDQLFTAGPNGNDAFTLEKSGVVVDLFGTIGCDPGGDGWIVDGRFTKDVTLRRKPCIIKGVTSSSGCNFPRSGDWIAYPVNTFSGLGNHEPGSAEVEIMGNGALCENPEITLEATEGFSRYRWSTGESSRSISVNSAGTYSVTVTTALGCTAEDIKLVNGTSPEIFATISNIKPASCRPKKDGSFSVNPSGGAGGFSYAWETGSGTSSTITGLGAGTYNVTVTDDNGCSIVNEVVVGGDVTVPLTATPKGETCKGRHDGTITLSASGSNLQYSIDGDNFDSKNYFTDLAPGDYLVQVIDNQGCGDAKNIKVEGGTRFTLSNSIVAQSKCQGEGNGGQIILEPEGGRRPYTVSFDGGPFLANNFVFSDLKGDTFDIVIRDASGCEKSFEQEIEAGSDLVITGYDLTPATCAGIDDGGINIKTESGSGDFSYSVLNDAGILFPYFNPNFEDLSAGEHTIFVRDNPFDCIIPLEFEILEESPLLTNIINPTPCGDDQKATITVEPQTGIAPYQYSLDTGAFVDINIFSDLDPMAYVVTTMDGLGCIKVDSVDFEAAESFEIQLAIPSAESCANFGDGQITIFTNNATTAEYRLDNGAYVDSPVFSGLSSGDYTVYAKSGACTDSAMVTILPATPIVLLDAEPQIALCEGDDDGQLTITVSGGAAPYQYKLENTPYQANNVFTNLRQGNYTLTVRDANLCEQTFTDVTLAGPVRLDANCVVTQHVSTKDGSDGAAQITVFGGASPYNIQLVDAGFNNIISSTGVESFTNIPAGDYTVAITDFNGCTTTCNFTINEPQCDFSIDHTKSDATCFEATDGTISLVLPAGNTPYTFNWLDAQYNGQAQLTGLAVGTYSVTVTDQAGCTDSLTASITEPPLLSVEIIADNETICEKDTAQLRVTSNYAQYNWSNTSTDAVAKVYEAGTYQVSVRNADGCVAMDDIVINVIAQDTMIDTRFTCDASSVGTFAVEERDVDGCMDVVIRTFELARRDTTSITTTTCNPSEAGVVRNRYNNIFGCDSLVVTTTNLLRSDTTYQTEMSCNSDEVGFRDVVLTNAVGCDSTLIIETILDDILPQSSLTAFTCNVTEVGIDTAILKTLAGCDSLIITQTISNVSEPTSLATTTCNTANVSIDTLFLTNQFLCDSLVVINTTLAPSDFLALDEQSCNPLDTGLVIQNLINQFGCDSTVETRTTLIPINDCQLGFSLLADTICWDASQGTIQLLVTEGNPPFNYYILNDFWRDTVQRGVILTTDVETILTNIPVGQYSIVLVNDRNVRNEERIAVNQANEIIVDGLFSDYAGFAVSCEGATDGSIDLNITGGQAPYTYLWGDGTDGENLQNLATGNYQVTVMDVDGCQQDATFDLFSASEMQIDFQSFSPKCFGDVAGRLTIYDLPNANGTVEYSLDGVLFQPIGALPFTIEDLRPNEYQLFVQDENDCQASALFSVPMPIDNQLTIGDTKNLILGDSLTLTPKANFEIDRFEWSATVPLTCENCSEIKTIPTQNGAYTLTAYDANGCKNTASMTVNLRKESQVYLPNVFSPNNDGNNDVYQVLTGNIVKRLKSLKIFDYEGRLMYQVTNRPPNDAAVGWDGMFNGQKMLPAVFVVFVEVELLDGTNEMYRQTMTLVK